MRQALLDSKLHIPTRRRGLVTRARLLGRLRTSDLPAVVVVSAPAGAGKSTLLTAWLDALVDAGVRVAWVSLDRRDSDPALYWAYLVAAVRRAVPGAGEEALDLLHGSPGALEAVAGSLLNDLAGLGDDLVVVLDDYHAVESLDVHESMRFFVDHLPNQAHLVVAGRADPPWPLSGLRARGRLVEIRAADLRFTAEEAAAYLNGAMGLGLRPEDVDALEARTEGWIAALQLAALSLQGRDDPTAFIAEFAGDDRFVFDYLLDEVLDRQPEDIRSFLLQTSILSRLSAPLCSAVTGREDARQLLETLDRSNLFVIPLDDRRRWYRYHHLFADVLRARLDDEHPLLVTELHRRASRWFDDQGDRPEALRHALAAGDHDEAAAIVELGIPDLRQARQDVTQQQWLDALPERLYENRPVLNLARVGARMVRGDTAGVDGLLDDIEAWLDPDRPKDDLVVSNTAEFARLPTQAAMYRAGVALLRGDLTATIDHGRRAAALAAPGDHLGKGAAAALVGLAQWAAGELAPAARQYTAAITEFHAAEHHADILGCSLGLADMLSGLGQLGAARRALRAGLDLAEERGPLRGTADMHIGLAEAHLERGELDDAAAHLAASLELGERLALGQHAYRWRVVDARLRSIRGDHAGALELLREAQRHYHTDYSPEVRPVAATTARVHLAAGDLAAARRWALDAGVAATDDAAYRREYEHLTLARLLLAEGRAAEALPLLARVEAAARAGGRTGSAAEASLLAALAQHAAGQRQVALASLARALELTGPEQQVGMFLETGTPVVRLLEAAIAEGRAAEQARAVLAAIVATSGSRPPSRPGLVDELSSRELEVLRLLRSELTGPEIAAALFVSLNTFRTHTKNIFTKLAVTNRRAAVLRADELGL